MTVEGPGKKEQIENILNYKAPNGKINHSPHFPLSCISKTGVGGDKCMTLEGPEKKKTNPE